MLLTVVLFTAAAPVPLAAEAPAAAELAPVALLPPPPPAAAGATTVVGPTPVMKRWKISKFFPIILSSPEQRLGEGVSNRGSNLTLLHIFGNGGRDGGHGETVSKEQIE